MQKLLTVIFLFASGFSFAQVTFHKTIGGTQDEFVNGVQQTADGGYIIVGHTKSFGAGDMDVYLIKTDANGDSLWTRTYGSSGNEQGKAVQQTADGGYIISGQTSGFGVGLINLYVIKTDNAGNLEWEKTFGGPLQDFGFSIREVPAGGYIVAGQSFNFGPGGGDVLLIRINSVGDSLWTKAFGGLDADWANSIVHCMDGGFVMAGVTKSFGDVDGDVYLVKTDSIGNIVWAKKYGGTNIDAAVCVEQTADSGYIITGNTRSFGAGGTDVYLLKTNSTGDTLWTRAYGGSSFDYGNSVWQSGDGGYLVAGYTQSFLATGSDMYLIKTDSSGALLWSRTYSGTAAEFGYGVEETQDGGIFVAGYTASFGAGFYDVYLVKENNMGNSGCIESTPNTIVTRPATQVASTAAVVTSAATAITSPSSIIGTGGTENTMCTSVGVNEEVNSSQGDVSIVPNPFSNQLTINCKTPTVISIFDISGKKILHQSSATGEAVLNTEVLVEGLYFLRVNDGVGVRNYKIVKQ
jgi:hypothetical protein